MPKEIKILSACFFVTFFAYNGVQQFLTAYFADLNMVKVGFWSLILIYTFILIANFFSGFIVARLGAKKSLVLGSLFFTFFIFSPGLHNTAVLYLASALLGCGAAILWTAQGVLLVRSSDKDSYGKNSGFFSVIFQLGSVLGIILFGLLIAKTSFNSIFALFGFISIIGTIILFFLKKIEPAEVNLKDNFRAIKKAIVSPLALRLSLIWFSFSLIIASVSGQFPLEIKKYFGLNSIGFVTPIFYFLPIVFSYYLGRASDVRGRKSFLIISYVLVLIGLGLFVSQIQFGLPKIFFILSFLAISLGYAVYAPLRFALMGDVSSSVNLESIAAVSVVASNLGYVTVFLVNLYLPPVFSYLIPLLIIVVSFVIVLPMLRSKKA